MMLFFKFLVSKSCLKQLLLLVIATLLLGYGIAIWIDHYTRHGQRIIIPNVVNLDMHEAAPLLEKAQLKYIIVDSVFSEKAKPGAIIEQQPSGLSAVKEGHEVSLIINPYTEQKVPVPDLKDVSLRQGQLILEASGFQLGRLIYIYSEYKDIIISELIDSVEITESALAKKGTVVDLVVGMGLGNELVTVPSLANMNLAQVKQCLQDRSLTLGSIILDSITTTNPDTLVVYQQNPSAGRNTQILMGRSLSIWLTADRTKAMLAFQTDSIQNLADSLGISLDSLSHIIRQDSTQAVIDSTSL